MDTEKLEKEFEFVKKNLNNEKFHLVDNYYPFTHLPQNEQPDSEEKFVNGDDSLNQAEAYIFDYQLPQEIKIEDMVVRLSKNQGVHPDRHHFTFKDDILLNWVEDAFATSFALKPDEVPKKEYKLVQDEVKRGADDAYWQAHYRINYGGDY